MIAIFKWFVFEIVVKFGFLWIVIVWYVFVILHVDEFDAMTDCSFKTFCV